jgi:transposase
MRTDFEAFVGAHCWARTLNKLVHDTSMMVAKYTTPCRTKEKNDLNDSVAIYKAV